jgi:hypothetical protein
MDRYLARTRLLDFDDPALVAPVRERKSELIVI